MKNIVEEPNETWKEVRETYDFLKYIAKGQKLTGVSTTPDYKTWTLWFETFAVDIPNLPYLWMKVGEILWDGSEPKIVEAFEP
jgi:hypothetical protein